MQVLLCFAVLVAAVSAGDKGGYAYHGRYSGKCGSDGFYDSDDYSFVICSNGNAYKQPCPPGAKNSGSYLKGHYYSAHPFCDVNLVDHGYTVRHGGYGHDNKGYGNNHHGHNNHGHNSYGHNNHGYGHDSYGYGGYNRGHGGHNNYGYGNNYGHDNYGYGGHGRGYGGYGNSYNSGYGRHNSYGHRDHGYGYNNNHYNRY